MSTPNIDGKAIINTAYHGTVVGGLAIGVAKLTKAVFKATVPKLDLDSYDVVLTAVDISIALALRDVLVRMGLPDDIMK